MLFVSLFRSSTLGVGLPVLVHRQTGCSALFKSPVETWKCEENNTSPAVPFLELHGPNLSLVRQPADLAPYILFRMMETLNMCSGQSCPHHVPISKCNHCVCLKLCLLTIVSKYQLVINCEVTRVTFSTNGLISIFYHN